jgi:hypothetical protein
MKPCDSVATNVHIHARDILGHRAIRNPYIAPTFVLISCVTRLLAPSAYCQDRGTAAFAVWQPDQIVLGVDSKVTHLNGEPPGTTCKIRRSGRFFYAIAGFYGQTGSDFDVWDISARSLKTAKNVPSAASILEHSIAAKLPKAIEAARLSNPEEFDKKLSKSYLAFFVAGLDSGNLVMVGRNFVPGNVLREEYPGRRAAGAGATGLSLFGDRSIVDQMYTPRQEIVLAASNPVETVRKFIQLEIDGEPDTIGGPRSILVIGKNGHRWEEEGLCNK